MENEKSSTHDRELIITRRLNAPVELVWEVWTKPEHIAKWWGPTGFTNTITTMDVEPGGTWELVMHGPDGKDYQNKSVFKEVVPFEKIVFQHFAPNFVTTVEFEAQGDKTFLKWHMLFESAEQMIRIVKSNNAAEGLKQNVDKLSVYLKEVKTSGYAPVNGLKMYYEIHGSGEMPLLLIHGGGSTIETSFGNILPKLAAFTKIIAVELQAHGRTSDRDTPESFTQDADDVAALLRHLKVGKANVLGFSDGGCTTMQLAGRHPELVNKIVVVASNYTRAGMIDGFFDMMENASLDNMPAPLKEAYLKVNPDPNGLQTMFNKDRERRRTFTDWPQSDLTRIQAPTLIMSGDQDVIKTEHIVEISHLIPTARLVILPGIHGALLGEICTNKPHSRQPEVTALLVREFLAE
ncbi:hypothetical protein GCM10010967_14780 [Dyadobacter beijingensis]|uniref:Pimeloyl-ACP methyl ester carboxylesterase n=1 Tax=Dyadobacter beijingensis TaxID=365489 RepID=A0ABQ2HJW5_9BACT|nr:alpha/beta fold hydrolase [Dyadobacter beijingensis]GGM84017.1 hypothetical protein GCM10010967_14780 [Dyadobacter beijingensis]